MTAHRRLIPLVAALWLGMQPAAAEPDQPVDLSHAITTPSGLRYVDLAPGQGPEPAVGEIVAVRYAGYLFADGQRGAKFDEVAATAKPLEFLFGRHRVIPAWDEALATMRPGAKRLLVVPPELGYGDRGAGGVVPPHATLLFELTLVAIKPPPKKPELDHPI